MVAATNFHTVTGLRMDLSRPRIFTRRLVYIQMGIDEFIAVPAALVAVVQRTDINTGALTYLASRVQTIPAELLPLIRL
jgi:hypothetical protein